MKAGLLYPAIGRSPVRGFSPTPRFTAVGAQSGADPSDRYQAGRSGSSTAAPPAASQDLRERRQIADYRREARDLLRDLPGLADSPEQAWKVRSAVETLLRDARRLEQKGAAGAHSAWHHLRSLIARIRRVRASSRPAEAMRRQRLDAPVPNFGEVVPGVLYRGAQPSSRGMAWLAHQGIRTVISLRQPRVEDHYAYADFTSEEEEGVARSHGMRFVNLPVPDHGVPTADQVRRFLQIASDPRNQPVFVHCAAGIGRTSIMSALFERSHGVPADQALEHSRPYGLEFDRNPEHARQAGFVQKYPLERVTASRNPVLQALQRGEGVVLLHTRLDTSRGLEDVRESGRRGQSYEIDGNRVEIGGKSYLVNAHDPRVYEARGIPFPAPPERLHPAPLIEEARKSGVFVKFDFKTPRVVTELGAMARALPPEQKMGHAFVKELSLTPGIEGVEEALSLEDVDRARKLLGPGVPFQVSARGITGESLTPERVDALAEKVKGHAEILNFNLPEGQNPPVEIARYLWQKHGLATEIKIRSAAEKAWWDSQGIPYVGVTDRRELATVLREEPHPLDRAPESEVGWLVA